MKSDLDLLVDLLLEKAKGNHTTAKRMFAQQLMKKRRAKRELTQDELRERLGYDPTSGIFVWKKSFKTKIGKEAGYLGPNGYRYIRLKDFDYLAHRLAWFYMTDKWPTKFIDHVNGNPSDNSWKNLREATQSQNMANQLSQPRKLPRGIYFRANRPRHYLAKLQYNGETFHIGYFATLEEATAAWANKAKSVFGKFYSERSAA